MQASLPWFSRRVPYVPQMDIAECGAACLVMILGAYGCHVPLVSAREACGVSRDGSNAYSIAKAAQQYGLLVQALRTHDLDPLGLPLPAIAHWKQNHFVVIERLGRRTATIVDPTLGRRTLDLAELRLGLSGVVLTVRPGPQFRKMTKRRPSMRRYLRTLEGASPTVAFVLLVTFVVELVGTIFPAASQVLIDFVIRPKQDRWLVWLAIMLAMATAVRLAMMYVRDRVLHVLHCALDISLTTHFADHLLRVPFTFLQQRTTGDLMNRVGSNSVLGGFTVQVAGALLDGLLVVAYGALMIAYDRRLGALVVALSLARVVAVAAMQGSAQKSTAIELACQGRESTTTYEALSVPEISKAFGMERVLLQRYVDRLVERLNAGLRRRFLVDGVGQAAMVLDGAAQAVVVWMGGVEVLDDRMTFGTFAAFLTLQSMLARPMAALLGAVQQFSFLRHVLSRIDDILESPTERSGPIDPGIISGEIVLDRVSFQYGLTGARVVDDVSLHIHAGEKIAVVGPSGAGKSTLARLMLGTLVPTGGEIRLDGCRLDHLDLQKVRRQFGVVLQEPSLFNDTVRANLCLGRADLPLPVLERAASLACLDTVLSDLPLGFDTELGERGGRLSGGQKQRVAVARAIAHGPRVLFLDEATSSLDLETERRLHDNLRALRCTRIVIAHRLATVMDADHIVVMDKGRVVQSGRYGELAAARGLFRSMVETLG